MEEKEPQAGQELREEKPGRSLWGDAVYRLRKDKLAVISFAIIVAYFIVAILSWIGLIASRSHNGRDAPETPRCAGS